MVEIRFRIIQDEVQLSEMSLEQLNNEGSVEGFFSININGYNYGYYHNNLLREGEMGFDLITTWFEHLTKAYLVLSESKYVAVSDIDSYNTWIEFIETEDKNISVSIIKNEDKIGKGYYVAKPFITFDYGDWKHIVVKKEIYRSELISQANKFIQSLCDINPKYLETNRVRTILAHLNNM